MKLNRLTILAVMLCLSVLIPPAHAQQQVSGSGRTDNSAKAGDWVSSAALLALVRRGSRSGFSLMPWGRPVSVAAVAPSFSNSAVHGSGTVGKISLWVDVRPNGDSTLGDSIITQLNGNIGIGTDAPTSKLTVQGTIETTLGGYRFADGTEQTTAAVSGLQSVTHDSSLAGEGTSGSPLRVALPLNLIGAKEAGFFLVSVINTNNGGSYFGGNGIGAGGGPSESNYGGIG